MAGAQVAIRYAQRRAVIRGIVHLAAATRQDLARQLETRLRDIDECLDRHRRCAGEAI